jgi:ABC-type polar amino acid transport system ATPase subunit
MTEIDWTKPRLRAQGIRKTYDDRQVLGGIDLEVYSGQIVALLGSSGSGKSTLLRCLNLTESLDDGQIWLEEDEISKPGLNQDAIRSQVGMVFQQYNLFAHLTILQNIVLALRHVKKLGKAEAEEIAMHWLTRIGLAEKANQYPDKLSGGQQQRTAIARAVALNPKLLLLDEVTSALDPELVGEVLELIRDLKAAGTTIVMATHEMEFARAAADWVVFLDAGVIAEEAEAEEFFANPKVQRTKDFLARMR